MPVEADRAATINYLSKLSLISLPEEEHGVLMEDIANILTYIRALDALDVREVLPTYYGVAEEQAVVREDTVREFPEKEALVSRAPETTEHLVKVQGVFGHGP